MTPIAFDLDGTLVDSAPDLHRTANELLRRNGRDPLSLGTVRGFVGNGVPALVERIVGAAGLPSGNEALAGYVSQFSEIYLSDPVALTRPYPGVGEALAALAARGHLLAICTNKPVAPSRAILDHFGFSRFFGSVVGGDSLDVRKPDPAPLFAALGDVRGLFVGDSDVDATTARAAEIPLLLFTEGYRKSPVAELPHCAEFARFTELPALVERVTG